MTDRLAERERLLKMGGPRLADYTLDLEWRLKERLERFATQTCPRRHLEWPWVTFRRWRFERHLERCGCADPDRGGRGVAHCDEAVRLFKRLPDHERVLVG